MRFPSVMFARTMGPGSTPCANGARFRHGFCVSAAAHADKIRHPIRLVNHFLETPLHDEGRSDRPPPTLGATGSGEERVWDAVCDTVSKKGRVLLLEPDPCFRDALSDCLLENGYKVVAVANTHQAFSEITANDFALVLYDPTMPGLSGEMFCRSVYRIDPELCGRFVFMSDDHGDAKTNEFIKNINGFVLKKPFDVKNLLASLALAESHHTFHGVFDFASTDPFPPQVCQTADVLPPGGTQLPEESVLREKACPIPAGPQTPVGPSDALLNTEPQLRGRGMSLSYALAALALLLALAGGLWLRYLNARHHLDAASSQRLGREAEWTAASLDLQTALSMRAKAATAQSQLARISAIRAKPHWAPVLRGIVPLGDAKIDIVEISARGEKKDPGACEVRICGTAFGSPPMLMADRYRQSVEQILKRIANGRPVSARLDQLPEAPGTPPDEKRADFVMVVTIGSIEPSLAISKEGR